MKTGWRRKALRNEVVDFVHHWVPRVPVSQQQMLKRIGIGSSKFYDWAQRYDQDNQNNEHRLHSAIGYITPKDKLEGRETIIFDRRKRLLQQARERGQISNHPISCIDFPQVPILMDALVFVLFWMSFFLFPLEAEHY